MNRFIVVSIVSLIYGGAMIVLFAHAIGHQQVVMQEGY